MASFYRSPFFFLVWNYVNTFLLHLFSYINWSREYAKRIVHNSYKTKRKLIKRVNCYEKWFMWCSTEKKNKENLKCDQAAIYYQQLKVHAMRTLFIIYKAKDTLSKNVISFFFSVFYYEFVKWLYLVNGTKLVFIY